MNMGELLALADGNGTIITASITKADKRHCEVQVEEKKQVERPKRKISIAISLLKNANRFEWFLEKATEIGVSEIIPLICRRTERQHFRYDRMKNILIAAMLQSQQAWLPALHEPVLFNIVVNDAKQAQKFVAHCLETEKQHINALPFLHEVLMLIGPEGDFTTEEIDTCLKQGFIPVTLGNTRLRTETAGIVAATFLANL